MSDTTAVSVVPAFTPAQRDWLEERGHGLSHAIDCEACRIDLLNIYRAQWDRGQAEELAYAEAPMHLAEWEQALLATPNADEQLREQLRAENQRLMREIERLRTEQVRANDPRLTDFWEQAARAADDADHCQEYDNLAEALGGPRRNADYTVRLRVNFYVDVNVTSNRRADRDAIQEALDDDWDYVMEQVQEAASNLDSSDIETYSWDVA